MAIIEGVATQSEDVALVHRMAQGDELAVRKVYEACSDPLYRFVRRRHIGPSEDAEEIVNDVFLSAIRNGMSFEGRCAVLTWLCGIALSRITDRHRRSASAKRIPERQLLRIDDEGRGTLKKIFDPSAPLEELVERLDRVRLVQSVLDSLTPEQREAIVLRYVEGFSLAEVAMLMKRSEKAVERLLERAKERPRQELFRWFGEDSFRALCLEVLCL